MLGTLILLFIIGLAIVQYIRGQSEAIGNWAYLFPELEFDPESFYSQVEELLKARSIPNIFTTKRNIKEYGALSHFRVYLEVKRGDYIFHICAAPWGTGFFFSWWLREKLSSLDELLIMIPVVGPRIVKLRQYKSYYKLDTDIMFRKSVHECIMAAIDQITESKGLRGLSELERKPDLRSFIGKK